MTRKHRAEWLLGWILTLQLSSPGPTAEQQGQGDGVNCWAPNLSSLPAFVFLSLVLCLSAFVSLSIFVSLCLLSPMPSLCLCLYISKETTVPKPLAFYLPLLDSSLIGVNILCGDWIPEPGW